jgi:hypothetical protein
VFVTNKRVAKKNCRQKVFLFFIFFQPICKFSGRSDNLLAAGAKGLNDHGISVVDRHRFGADPDPNFHVDANPDPPD